MQSTDVDDIFISPKAYIYWSVFLANPRTGFINDISTYGHHLSFADHEAAVSHGKRKTDSQVIFLDPFTICSSCKLKFAVCSFVYVCKRTKRTCPSIDISPMLMLTVRVCPVSFNSRYSSHDTRARKHTPVVGCYRQGDYS